MKTYLEFLQTPSVISACVNYYTGKITGSELDSVLEEEIKKVDEEVPGYYDYFINHVLGVPENFQEAAPISSSSSFLSTLYDMDYEDAPEGAYEAAEKVRVSIVRQVNKSL